MIVECIGLPACGKSKTAKQIIDLDYYGKLNLKVLLKGDGQHVPLLQSARLKYLSPKVSIVIVGIYSMIKQPVFSFYLYSYIICLGPNMQRILLGMLLVDRYNKIRCIPNDGNLIFQDEGIFQYFASLLVGLKESRKVSARAVLKYLFMKVPLTVVFHELSVEESLARILERRNGHTRFEKMSKKRAILNLNHFHLFFIELVNMAEEQGVKVIRVNAQNDVRNKSLYIVENLPILSDS